MPDEVEEALVERTLDALKEAKSDTQIFAALLLVTKIVKVEDVDKSICKRVCEAVGFNFIERMLQTREMADGCPLYMYQSVAYTILASFCMVEDFAVHPDMIKFIDNFKVVLLSNPSDPDEQFMVSDVLQCVRSIANYDRGRRNLLDRSIVTCLAQVVEDRLFNHEETLNVLLFLTKLEGHEIWSSNLDALCDVIEVIAKEFRDDSSERKFELCSILFEFLTNFPSSVKVGNANFKRDWINWIHKGLRDILQSRIGKEQRDPALLLLSVMLECFGTEWLIQSGNESDKKFVLAVLHLMCIEIRILLETQSVEDVIKESLLITSCYAVLEKLIMAVTAGDYILGLDHKQTLQFVSAMTATFKAVMKFLCKVNELWESSDGDEASEKIGKSLVMASFRVLCSWLAEETSAAREEIDEVLPFLFKLAIDNLNLKQCSDDEDRVDIMRFFLAPLCHLSAEDSSRLIIIERKFYQVVAVYLDSIWKKFVKSSFNCDELEAALSTMCGIFMNIVVLEKDLIVQEEVFHEIFLFIFTALPQLNNKRDHLILRANLAVLGLLLMKHYISKVSVTESKFRRSCISFSPLF